jgi:hypothetical protein
MVSAIPTLARMVVFVWRIQRMVLFHSFVSVHLAIWVPSVNTHQMLVSLTHAEIRVYAS